MFYWRQAKRLIQKGIIKKHSFVSKSLPIAEYG